MTREWKPSKPCMDCISYEYESAEVAVLVGRSDAAWNMLKALRDALRRMDPAWCKLHQQEQISDEDLELVIGKLEDMLEDER